LTRGKAASAHGHRRAFIRHSCNLRIVRMHDPGAHGATAPRPTAARSTPVHGAKAKPPDGGAGA
jgi:hypothetical protein